MYRSADPADSIADHAHTVNDILDFPDFNIPVPEVIIPDYHDAAEWNFQKIGLFDTDRTNILQFYWNEDDDTNRQINLSVNSADRNFALHGNLTVELNSWIDQDLTKDSTVARFDTLTVTTKLQDGPASSSLLLESVNNNIVNQTWFSIIMDIDLNNSSEAQSFLISHDGQGEDLFEVFEDGDVFIYVGNLDLNGGSLLNVGGLSMAGDLDLNGYDIIDVNAIYVDHIYEYTGAADITIHNITQFLLDAYVNGDLTVGVAAAADAVLRFWSDSVVKHNIYWDESLSQLIIAGDATDNSNSLLSFSATEIIINESAQAIDFLVKSDLIMGAGYDLDCFTNGAYFKPRRVSQAAEPTPDLNELLIWIDTDDNKMRLVYNDSVAGVLSVEVA